MCENRWVTMSRRTSLGTQTGRLESTDDELVWNLVSTHDIPDLMAAITDRIDRVTLSWFAAGGDPSTAIPSYSLDDFLKENNSELE